MNRPQPWPLLRRERLLETPIFALRRDRKRHPSRGTSYDFYVLEAGDWVNVIPLTAGGEVVLVEQHRHGVDAPTLEIPGGMVDGDDPSPRAAAVREMLEETGYTSERVERLGSVHPNPALQSNRCHTFLAHDVVRVATPRLDGGEEIRVLTAPLASVPQLVREGHITHSLVIAAFHWLHLAQTGRE